MSFIEETLVLKDTKLEEINKYFLPDNLSEIDWITYILKKGYSCQKEHFIKNLYVIYLTSSHPSFIFSIIRELIANIELYDKQFQINFSHSLQCLAQSLPITQVKGIHDKNIIEDNRAMIKLILLHFFTAISTLEKSVSEEYALSLNKLIDYYTTNEIRLGGIDDLIEYATSLGKFGQCAFHRKASVYLISKVIRISIEKSPLIYRRLLFLCDDSDRFVRFEVAYQMRYILKEDSNNKEYIKKNFIPYLLNYFNEDNDLSFKSVLIDSVLLNITKFNTEFINDVLSKQIDAVFSITDYHTIDNEFNYFIDIFLSVLNTAFTHKAYRNVTMGLITKYLRRFYKVNELKNSLHVTKTLEVDYCIEHFDKIAQVYIEENDVLFLNQLVFMLLRYAFKDERHMCLFYSVLDKIIMRIGHIKEIVNSNFIRSVYYFFDVYEVKGDVNETLNVNHSFSNSKDINNANSNSSVNYVNANGNANNVNILQPQQQQQLTKESNKDIWMNNFDIIIKNMIDNDNDTFFLLLFSKVKVFEQIVLKCDDWRKQIVIFKALALIPQYITLHYIKYPNYDETLSSYFYLAKEFLAIRRNYILEQEIMKFVAVILPYAQTKCNVVQYMNEYIVFNYSYFRRRLAVYFFEAIYAKLSISYMKKLNLYQNSIDLLDDNVPQIQSSMITLFTNMHNKDQEVYQAISQIDSNYTNSTHNAIANDILLHKSMKTYIDMYKAESSLTEDNLCINKEEEAKIIREKKIKEIEIKVLEIRRKDAELYLFRKKKTKLKPNASAVFTLKKTFSKQSTLTSKFIQKMEEQGNKSKRKSSMMSMQIQNNSIIASKEIRIGKQYKPTTPKTKKELKRKK